MDKHSGSRCVGSLRIKGVWMNNGCWGRSVADSHATRAQQSAVIRRGCEGTSNDWFDRRSLLSSPDLLRRDTRLVGPSRTSVFVASELFLRRKFFQSSHASLSDGCNQCETKRQLGDVRGIQCKVPGCLFVVSAVGGQSIRE